VTPKQKNSFFFWHTLGGGVCVCARCCSAYWAGVVPVCWWRKTVCDAVFWSACGVYVVCGV